MRWRGCGRDLEEGETNGAVIGVLVVGKREGEECAGKCSGG